ncbi:hypothetical protein C8F01DRAFT_1249498 [Mycena amicta]|nr:hypothetical protein C8F01DRAFT_1249498 [Mycena amicta]
MLLAGHSPHCQLLVPRLHALRVVPAVTTHAPSSPTTLAFTSVAFLASSLTTTPPSSSLASLVLYTLSAFARRIRRLAPRLLVSHPLGLSSCPANSNLEGDQSGIWTRGTVWSSWSYRTRLTVCGASALPKPVAQQPERAFQWMGRSSCNIGVAVRGLLCPMDITYRFQTAMLLKAPVVKIFGVCRLLSSTSHPSHPSSFHHPSTHLSPLFQPLIRGLFV